MEEWRNERARHPNVGKALDDLSQTEGAHGFSAVRWYKYLKVRHIHRENLWREFVDNDERCKKRMVSYRAGKRALSKAADRILREAILEKKPVIVGYRTGRGNGGGHKGEASVPVKQMYTALRQAFRRHRVKGGILDVWEAYTTQKCHRCGEQLASREIPFTADDIMKSIQKHNCMKRRAEAEGAPLPPDPDPPFESRSKRDRDFRICER
jgi:hypothetical protein